MSIEEQIQQALELHRQGRMNDSTQLCLSLLAKNETDFRVHFLLGMLYQQQDEEEPAIHHFEEAVSLYPELASGHYNLGALHFSKGNIEEAVNAYRKAGELTANDPDIFFNLALALKTLGRFREAEQEYEKVLTLTPTDPDTHYNLGVLFRETGQTEKAIHAFEKTISLAPDYIPAHNNLAYLFHKQGLPEMALESYRKVIELDPGNESAKHMAAALTGQTTSSSPLSYVKNLFDQFSDDFDESLQEKLEYSTPTQLRRLLDAETNNDASFQNGLDMGCGTGLSGAAFADRVARFTGLDLSGNMLLKAREKGLYSTLEESDIAGFLTNTPESFDFFLAADVFVYIGDLSEIFTLVQRKCRKNAFFLFSTEECKESFCLQPSGRYAHAESYIRQTAEKSGLHVTCCQQAKLRKERGEWIMGNLYLLKNM
ncbi:MAG: tetratricopeptide repeat protein [Desulfobulbaceae bacterium]|nr:tetratricopeptide repeat protein [Desulfobulbaceae bacterium]